MMLVSGGLYGLGRNFSQKPKFIDYENCLIVGQIIGLFALYAAGNYFIVQTLSDEMTGRPSASLPRFGMQAILRRRRQLCGIIIPQATRRPLVHPEGRWDGIEFGWN